MTQGTTFKIFKYELSDVVRSRWIVAYALFFLVVTDLLFRFGGTGDTVLLSLTNVVLILVPLVCTVFGTMYLYSAREFVELLLAQPVDRRHLYAGLYAGLGLPLASGFFVGVGLPFAYHGAATDLTTLGMTLLAGVLLTLVFTALAFVVAVRFEDRVKGLGMAVAVWMLAAVLYDGIVLAIALAFANYPLEQPMIALTLFNPVDLARVLLLLQFDVSALMGYTGAVFERFFGSGLGVGVALSALGLWLVVPLWWGRRLFVQKDF